MTQSNNLSLEQQFKLVAYKNKIEKLTIDESKKYLMMTLRYMLIKDNLIKFLVRNKKF